MKKVANAEIKEYLGLIWLNFIVQIKSFYEWIKVAYNYYRNFQFLKIDTSLLFAYLMEDPFKISKNHLISKGKEKIYAYGETPLTTLDLISQESRMTAKDIVYELGCGRGRGCFWLHTFVHCKVLGIDFVPEFIANAKKIQAKFDLKNINFIHEDILNIDYTPATVIYLYGSCFGDDFIRQLVERLSCVSSGTKIITVSYPLHDYTDQPLFEVMKCFPAKFTWGEAEVYLQIKK